MNSIDGKKPFPWRCTSCREKSVWEATVDYVAQLYHDGHEYTVKVENLKTPKCERCGKVNPDLEAQRIITHAFMRQINLLTPEQIADARIKLGMTQQEFAAALGVSEATIARLERGGQIQTRSLDNLLRLFFEMAPVREFLATQQIATLASSPEQIHVN